MRGRKWSWSEKILFLTPLLFVLMAMATFLVPRDRVFRPAMLSEILSPRTHCEDARWRCGQNLKQIGLALAQYRQDCDDKLPPASSSASLGWVDVTQPYLKNWAVFRCPLTASAPKLRSIGVSDYYFNSTFSARVVGAKTPQISIVMGEGNDGRDLNDSRYSKSALPNAWRHDLTSPAHRHLTYEVWAQGKANYLFGDGHVKALAPAEICSQEWTFQPQ
ncbi:MAG TPA: H-X9-DG-CTERM domain-containing protein [Abditibacterium sp.]|jgi:prepilin-type processing-associated H-X9-DG protein